MLLGFVLFFCLCCFDIMQGKDTKITVLITCARLLLLCFVAYKKKKSKLFCYN